MELVEEAPEARAVGIGGRGPVEAEFSVVVGAPEGVEELSAEQLSERAHGKEVVHRGGDPALRVERQAASGDDAVDVGVEAQVARPGVQDRGDAELGAEALRIAAKLQQRSGGAGEEQVE